MNVSPVRHYSPPRYPTQDYLLDHPELLRLVPKRWRGNATVLAVLGATALLMTSCKDMPNPRALLGKSYVAPIFEHGIGRGNYGCMSTNPPLYLSEMDARTAICDEAKQFGVDFSDTSFVTFSRVVGKLDGYDEKRNIGYAFLSVADHDAKRPRTQAGEPLAISTAGTIDLRSEADSIRNRLSTTHPGCAIAIFYDPLIGYQQEMKALSDSERAEYDQRTSMPDLSYQIPHHVGEKELRAQVRDFIHWLKAQGVI